MHLVGDIGPGVEHADREEQDVLEVDEAIGGLAVVIGGVEIGDVVPGEASRRLASRRARPGDVVGSDDLTGLRPLDLACDVAGQRRVGEPRTTQHRCQDAGLARQDLGCTATDDARPEVAQLAQSRGMEGAGGDALDTELGETLAHLSGSA